MNIHDTALIGSVQLQGGGLVLDYLSASTGQKRIPSGSRFKLKTVLPSSTDSQHKSTVATLVSAH